MPERPVAPNEAPLPARPEAAPAAAAASERIPDPAPTPRVAVAEPAPAAPAPGRTPDDGRAGDGVRPAGLPRDPAPVPRPALADRPPATADRMLPVEPGRPIPVAFQDGDQSGSRTTCTSAQLRRFIKSRPWVPLHELRRRFGISGDDDDVTPIRVGDQRLFIGLPPAEARLVGELLGGGDVGYELSLDPTAPIVVGVYPMRPVPRS